jgi:two-component system, LytTR family, response regulator
MDRNGTIRTLVVDDDPLARERVVALLEAERGVEIVGECADGGEAVSAIRKHAPDLVFLDVQMPLLDGFGVVEAVGPDRMPTVIFTTAHDRFAVRAFEAHAVDYLLKPYDDDRFRKALRRARATAHRSNRTDLDGRLRALLEELQPKQRYVERLLVRSGPRIQFLRVDDIDWMEAEGNYIRLHVGQKSHLIRETMTSLESRLDPERFLRIHRSTVVNVDRIRELESVFQGEYVVVLRTGTKLSSSRGYRARIRDLLDPER